MLHFRLFFVILIASITYGVISQANETVITVGLPTNLLQTLSPDDIFESFYADNPDVRVVFVPFPQRAPLVESVTQNANLHLNHIADLATTADIVFVGSFEYSIAATKAGYFLDLSPLVNADTNLNPGEYFPPAWNAFQWNGGFWALPLNILLRYIIYDEETFEEANLNPPSASWTLEDLIYAADLLRVAEDEATIVPGFNVSNEIPLLLRSASGSAFSTLGQPTFATDEMARLAAQLVALLAEQTVTQVSDPTRLRYIPLLIGDTFRLALQLPNDRSWRAAPLPGGLTGSYSSGLAISAGASNPQLAYEVASYLAKNPVFIGRIAGDAPARRDLVELVNGLAFSPNLDDETRRFLQAALENALPMSELQFGTYLYQTLNRGSDSQEVLEALQDAQMQADEALIIAEERASERTTILVVQTPVPTASLSEGEIELVLLLEGEAAAILANPVNSSNSILESFTEADSQVARVITNPPGLDNPYTESDCIIGRANPILTFGNAALLLPVTPLTDVDPDFNANDFIGDTLAQLTIGGELIGIPISLNPLLLQYDIQKFDAANVPAPEKGWDVNLFETTLRALATDGFVPLATFEQGDILPYLMLIASYGALPVTFNFDADGTYAAAYNFSSPETQLAVEQVLNLAHEGLIDYTPLDVDTSASAHFGPEGPAMYFPSSRFSASDSQVVMLEAPYPEGEQYIPVAYETTAFFITRSSFHAEACYRLYQFLKTHHSASLGMPVLHSQIPDVSQSSIYTASMPDVYSTYMDQLESSHAVLFPPSFVSPFDPASYIQQRWIAQAFDDYVLRNRDLATALGDAQDRLVAFDECVETVPTAALNTEISPEAFQAYSTAIFECAVSVDPDLSG